MYLFTLQILVHLVQDRTVEQPVHTVALVPNAVEVVAAVQAELQPKLAQDLARAPIRNKLHANQIQIQTILFIIQF